MRVAAVLAGSRGGEDSVAALQDKPLKAFVRIDGKAMIDHVLQALAECGQFDKILVCIPPADYKAFAPGLAAMHEDGIVSMIPPEDSPAASALKLLDCVPKNTRLMLTTADHPLLSAPIIDAFLAGVAYEADVQIGMVPLALIQHKYPKSKRTKLRFRDGVYSGCNLFYFQVNDRAHALVSYWKRLEALRKKPLRMAFAIGPMILLGFLLRRLSLNAMLDTIGAKAGAAIRSVVLSIPEAGIDVDKIEDFELVEQILRKSPNV